MNTPNVGQLCAALRSYDVNSSRAALMDLDDAVARASGDEPLRMALEKELCSMLRQASSVQARLYVCAKLAMVGGVGSVDVLAEQLQNPPVCHAACNALQATRTPEALRALLKEMKKAQGVQKTQLVRAIASWGDPRCLSPLAALLNHSDVALVRAAVQGVAAAGTAKAAKILARQLAVAQVETKACLADACLTCAEILDRKGDTDSSQTLYHAVSEADVPRHIQTAARGHFRPSKRA